MDDDDGFVCGECDARSTYNADGLTYCINGHQLVIGPETGEDEDQYFQQGRKISKPRERASGKKVSKVYHGRKAFQLYLQAYQYILWQQSYALIHNKNLPPELWTIVRDLWTLKLAKLVIRLEEPDNEAERNNATDSNASSEEATTKMPTPRKTRRRTMSSVPRLIESVSLCYLGILLLRLDISLGDIYRWILSGDLIYHRAINSVPTEMQQKLPGEYQEALDTSILLKPTDLHRAVNRLAVLFSTDFAMTFPPLNSPLLLFKYLRRIALPIEIFPAAQKLQRILDVSFSYSSTLNRRYQDHKTYPEVRLMALLIVAVKLLYPFDATRQCPRSSEEPAAQSINWPRWIEMHLGSENNKQEDDQNSHARNFEITEDDVFGMSGKEIDEYMDWYQRTWAKTNMNTEGTRKEILDLFPLPQLSPESPKANTEQGFENKVTANLIQSQSFLVINAVITDEAAEDLDEEISRPGSSYKNWRADEDLSPSAKAFMGIAAEIIGVSVDALLLGVMQVERSIAKWKDRERRRSEFPDDSDELPPDTVGDAVDELVRMSIDGEVDDEMVIDR